MRAPASGAPPDLSTRGVVVSTSFAAKTPRPNQKIVPLGDHEHEQGDDRPRHASLSRWLVIEAKRREFLNQDLLAHSGTLSCGAGAKWRNLSGLRTTYSVARLGAGELDVAVPNRTHDEFGRLTVAFNQMVGRVRDMIAARDQLLVDVSHELRSPLTRMKVALELLPQSEPRTGMAADVAEMERMIAELLELERVRGGRGVSPVRHDLVPILHETVESFQSRPPGVRVTSMSREIPVDIDAEKFRTVLRNLLENALKYSLPDSRAVEVSAAQNGENVVVRVKDDGPGIPDRDMANLFEPFFRVDRSRSKKTGGYGLGLSISKRIVEAHGGTIAAENNSTGGASFVVTLPKAG